MKQNTNQQAYQRPQTVIIPVCPAQVLCFSTEKLKDDVDYELE